jgi:hypothetical protein
MRERACMETIQVAVAMVCSLIKAALMDLVKSKGRNIALQQVLKAPLRWVGSMS